MPETFSGRETVWRKAEIVSTFLRVYAELEYNEVMKNRDKYDELSLSVYEENDMVFVVFHDLGKDEVIAHLTPVFGETSAELFDRWLETDVKEEEDTILFPAIPRAAEDEDI